MSQVLVTGGSGFIGCYCIAQLIQAGHEVRTTVRRLSREADVRAMLRAAGVEAADRLSFVEADLERDAGWPEATNGIEYVLHVASPFPAGDPKDENELIIPARDGAIRVLRASRDSDVRRVVLTSSFAAIGYGHKQRREPFDETTWTNLDARVSAYVKSKTLAERAAWDFMEQEGGALELAVVNPVGVMGPVLSADYSSSIGLLKRMLDGGMPGCPNMYFGIVDVRDVADLHIRAMTNSSASGQRFLAVSGDFMSIADVAHVLRSRLPNLASKVPTRTIPNWVVRLAALRDPAIRSSLPELGKRKNGSSEKARRLLGWSPRSREDAIVATAESLARL